MTTTPGQSESARSNRHLPLILAGVLGLSTLLLFWPAIGYDFIALDDDVYVAENPWVQSGLTRAGMVWAFTSLYEAVWTPLLWLSFMMDVELFGAGPFGHHLTNILLHTFNVLLLFFVFYRATQRIWPCALLAALFAFHPLRIEAVAWITSRKDVLSSFFMLAGLAFYNRHVLNQQKRALAYSTGCMALALMAKPMAVIFPVMLLIMDYWPYRRLSGPWIEFRRKGFALIREKTPMWILGLAGGLLAVLAHLRFDAIIPIRQVALWERILQVFHNYVFYIEKTLWPANLAILYPMEMAAPPTWALAALVALTAITYAVWLFTDRYPWLMAGWLWFLCTLAPVIGIIRFGTVHIADRFTYIPAIGLAILIAWGFDAWMNRVRNRAIPAGIALLAVLALAATTRAQLRLWQDSETLFTHTLRVTRDNYMIHNNLGVAFSEQNRLEEAIPHFVTAIQINPRYDKAYENLANAFIKQRRFGDAVQVLERLMIMRPDEASVRAMYGECLLGLGELNRAVEMFEAAVSLDPGLLEARGNLGIGLWELGRPEQALEQWLFILEQSPDDHRTRYHVVKAYAGLDRRRQAEEHLRVLLQAFPHEENQIRRNLGLTDMQ